MTQLALAKHRAGRLPVQPAGTSALLTKLSEPDLSIGDVVDLVKKSPAIAARLVATANSAWSKPVSPIASIEQACARLGLEVVRTTTVALAVGSIFDTRACPQFDSEQFWATSILTAKLAAALTDKSILEPKTAQTAGLISNVGLLWLADAVPVETDLCLSRARAEEGESLGQLLIHHCGTHHRQASLELFNAWGFPAILLAGLGLDELDELTPAEREISEAVRLASSLACDIYQGLEIGESSCPDGNKSAKSAYEQETKAMKRTMRQVNALLA